MRSKSNAPPDQRPKEPPVVALEKVHDDQDRIDQRISEEVVFKTGIIERIAHVKLPRARTRARTNVLYGGVPR